ncbi:hypothetical protein HK099_006261 [Clydaea vesicula]|uniref:Uncharacterized protein n=1 Tax=Clydaea vesicula TaxID=447962 RepID=A0AAD5U653_9FUNG|nr:hypothetical protein HK099_006261 [Clydaea vesicula]KAJ3397083.1 hypothetical protein HDU92_000783 [Lobulomyces angularis]
MRERLKDSNIKSLEERRALRRNHQAQQNKLAREDKINENRNSFWFKQMLEKRYKELNLDPSGFMDPLLSQQIEDQLYLEQFFDFESDPNEFENELLSGVFENSVSTIVDCIVCKRGEMKSEVNLISCSNCALKLNTCSNFNNAHELMHYLTQVYSNHT